MDVISDEPRRESGMPSTAIRHIEYDDTERKLYVTFVTGRRYVYHDVEEDVHEAFRASGSKGTFFNQNIRDRYRFDELVGHD